MAAIGTVQKNLAPQFRLGFINPPVFLPFSTAKAAPTVQVGPESVYCFERTIRRLSEEFERIDYLEIGSAQGLSMSLIGFHLKQLDRLGTLVSIDPYLRNGYGEPNILPPRPVSFVGVASTHVTIDKSSRQAAERLYGLLGLDVNIMETKSHKRAHKSAQRRQKIPSCLSMVITPR